ncbi:hypothetical protein EVAR_72315_1 [Eumeta japonica]|uniref:Uncharacterized protein n=1 Tax=Eumeta variegata TaxID=151549 RepID=A0A4C1SR04_EUMVA|nr:hypothetical protein EVAR_72315_1 [Eumeta japonica]
MVKYVDDGGGGGGGDDGETPRACSRNRTCDLVTVGRCSIHSAIEPLQQHPVIRRALQLGPRSRAEFFSFQRAALEQKNKALNEPKFEELKILTSL